MTDAGTEAQAKRIAEDVEIRTDTAGCPPLAAQQLAGDSQAREEDADAQREAAAKEVEADEARLRARELEAEQRASDNGSPR